MGAQLITTRERAWNDVRDLLPNGWRLGPRSFDPGSRRSSVLARSPQYAGRLQPPATVAGPGEDELAALADLAIRLRELRDVERRRMALEARKRAAFHAHRFHAAIMFGMSAAEILEGWRQAAGRAADMLADWGPGRGAQHAGRHGGLAADRPRTRSERP